MSIATEIARLQQAKADLKASINAKGGTITDETIDEYASKVSALPSPKEEETKTVTPNFSSGNQVITPTSGKVLSQVTVVKDEDLIPENIVKDVNIFGVVGTAETGGGTTGGYRVTFDLAYNGYSNVTIQQTNGNNFTTNITPIGFSRMTVIFENVTYIKYSGTTAYRSFEGITQTELNAGKTLTNDVVLRSDSGGAD
jgi:hypothetical protein